MSQGNDDAAMEVFERCLATQERKLGANPLAVAKSYNKVAKWLLDKVGARTRNDCTEVLTEARTLKGSYMASHREQPSTC